MKNRAFLSFLMFCFLFVLSSKQADAQCTHTFNMYDSYGDGWNSASVNILVNGGIVVSSATLPSGSVGSVNFSANTGSSISLGGWVSGFWNSEISWDIKDGNGTIIASGVYGGLPNSTANCSAPPPCSAGEISVTLNMYDSYGDGWNGNAWTASSTTNSSISYGPFTLSSGSSGSTTFCVSEDCYAIICNYGSWQSEVSWQLVNNATGGVIATGGAPYSQSQIAVGSGSCSSPPPSPSAFCDDFDSYSNGSLLAASSSDWTTWTQPYNASEDVQITNSLSNSPSNSIYFNGTSSPGGPSDLILPFGSTAPYTSGYFNFSAEFYVVNGAYFNFQSELATNIGWAFEAEMTTAGVINFTHWNGTSSLILLSVNYPSNQWFELRMEIDLNINAWEVFIDGVSQGSFFNPNNKIASLDLYPMSGHQFYVDDVCYEYSTTPITSTYGCTDSTALNYNPLATIDDGSCTYPSCASNEQEIIITITTDDFPEETSWQLVDQNGGGFFISPGDLLLPNHTYIDTICVPDSNCYQFTISDVYGDGLCGSCWGGTDGSYNVLYAGTTVVSSTVANFGSSETTFNIGDCLYPPSNCPNNDVEIIITINTDDYPTETSWFLMDQYGGGWTNVPITSSFDNTTLVWTLCVPDTNCYTFTMLDAYGDGICCAWGSGSYNISYDGIVVASGGSFTFAEEHCGIGICTPNCQISIPSNAILENEPCGSDVNHGCDDNWKISNFTIQDADDCSWGWWQTLCGPEDDPDLFVFMTKNSNYFYYSDYYLDTWYPNSFSMYAGQNTPALEIPNQGLFTSPYVSGQNNTYEFSVGDDDGGFIQTIGWNNNDYLGSYTLPNSLTAGINSITTSTGDADVDYTAVAPTTMYTPLTNSSTIHGNFWAENNIRDTDWYDFTILNDSTIFTLNAISETPFNVMLIDASGGCGAAIVIDSTFAFGCDTINIQQTLQTGTYWLLTFPTAYSCMSCADSIDYLLDVSWTVNSILGCIDILACNFDPLATQDDGSCVLPDGCTDTTALNYDPLATCDDGSCIYFLLGCMDILACNFDPLTTQDDGSCILPDGCTDSTALNYDVTATCDDGSCIAVVYGCTDLMAYNYYPGANVNDPNNPCCYVAGCTDSTSNNYNGNACIDDGSCIYFLLGCMDVLACNFDPLASQDDGSCILPDGCTDSTALNYDVTATCDDGSCIAVVYGCTDPLAYNYYPGANANDPNNSCCYVAGCTDSTSYNYNGNACIDDGSCIYFLLGCMDILACNFDPLASQDDGSCMLPDGCTDTTALNYDPLATCDDGTCIASVYGCTDQTAYNYYAGANIDDGSCCYAAGCTDPLATNYDANACIDDGSCSFTSACANSPITGLFISDIIDDQVLANFDNMNTYDATGAQICRVDQIRIKYREVGTSAWSQKNIASPTGYDPTTGVCNSTQKTDKPIRNLTPATEYEWEVKVWYCNGGNGGWAVGPNFTTAGECPNVGNLTAYGANPTKATFDWDDSNGSYEFARIKMRVDSISNPLASDWFLVGGSGVSYGTFTKNKNGLVAGETYRGQARTWCDPNGGAYNALSWTSLVTWTQPASVRVEGGASIANLDVYPNPSRDVFNISFTSESIQDLRVRILNVVGEVIASQDLQQFTGEYTKQINLEDNAKGIYFLEIETNDGVINKKLILQ